MSERVVQWRSLKMLKYIVKYIRDAISARIIYASSLTERKIVTHD